MKDGLTIDQRIAQNEEISWILDLPTGWFCWEEEWNMNILIIANLVLSLITIISGAVLYGITLIEEINK